MKLVTFDIFDTVLARLVCDPASVFYFIGKSAVAEKLISCSPEEYIRLRREAERLSRIGHPNGEIDDSQIFTYLTRFLGIPEETGKRLRELEIEWESKLLRPVPGAFELIEKYRSDGYKIAFVSDMYWNSMVLKDFLKAHGFWKDTDQLWVSSEHGFSKSTGKLFHKVIEFNNIKTINNVTHYGNDHSADGHGAIKAGLSSKLITKGNPNKFENLLEKYRNSTSGLSSLLAGVGRITRMKYDDDSEKNRTIARIVGDVVGPVYTLFVLWVIRSAKEAGLKKLYFISRDGYVPYVIAQKIIGTMAPEIKVSYIYGSRQSWHIAGLFEFNDTTFNWLFDFNDGTTTESVIKRLGLEWFELLQFAPELNQSIKNPKSANKSSDFDILKQTIINNKVLRERILSEAAERRDLMLKYLQQEGFNDDYPAGMIEIGWSGRTRNSFERVVGDNKSKQLQWFYLGLATGAKLKDPERVHTYLFGPDLQLPVIDGAAVIAESFCFAPHASVMGFKYSADKVVPYFKEGIEASLDEWGRQFFLNVLNDYCDNIPLDLLTINRGIDLRTAGYNLLKEFSENPVKEDAMVWGKIPFEHDQASQQTFTLSPEAKFNYIAVKRALMFGTFAKASGGELIGAWGQGAWAARTSSLFPIHIFVFIGYMRISWKKEIRRILSESKVFFLRIFKLNEL